MFTNLRRTQSKHRLAIISMKYYYLTLFYEHRNSRLYYIHYYFIIYISVNSTDGEGFQLYLELVELRGVTRGSFCTFTITTASNATGRSQYKKVA